MEKTYQKKEAREGEERGLMNQVPAGMGRVVWWMNAGLLRVKG